MQTEELDCFTSSAVLALGILGYRDIREQ